MFTKTIFATFIAAQVLFALLLLTTVTAQAQTSTMEAARFYAQRGNARYDRDKWEQAIADYDRAITIEPRNAAVCALLLTAGASAFAIHSSHAGALGKLGITQQSRVGKLIEKIAPQTFKPKRAAALNSTAAPAAFFATIT